jgi:6-phospho-beta-glucosidase
MKIAVIGGGSTYTPEFVDGLARRAEALHVDQLCLMDVDEERLRVVGGFVKRMARTLAPALEIVLTNDLVRAVDGADFVLVQIRVGGQEARRLDERCGAKHGLIGQETTGLGGFRKAMRTIPAMLRIAQVVNERAPNAFLINFTNPVSIVTQAIAQHGAVKAIGLCNIPIGLRMDLSKLLGERPEAVKLDSVGLNHLSFVRRVLVGGQDVLPKLLLEATGDRRGRPANIPELDYPAGFLQALGMVPSDYLRYFFLEPEMLREQRAQELCRAEEVMAIESDLLRLYADESNASKPESLSKRGGAFYSHAALELIAAIAEDRGEELVVDVCNAGAVSELARDAVVEVPCVVDSRGARPITQPPLPPEIRGLIQHVKAYEDLTVAAAVERSRRKAMLALVTNPAVRSATIALEVVREVSAELGLS